MSSPPRPHRELALGLAALGIVVALVGGWWLRRDPAPADAVARTGAASTPRLDTSPARPAPTAAAAGQASAGPDWTFQTELIPVATGGPSLQPARIGIARATPEDEAAFREWQTGSGEGAGPSSLAELAQIDTWVEAPASRLPEGRVQLGPVLLPLAERYDLEASGNGPLVYYRASFTPKDVPTQISPMVAAGIVLRFAGGQRPPNAAVLLRRVEAAGQADQSQWQNLMASQAPALLAAYGEMPLPLPADGVLAPLPPGPVDVEVQVDGITAARFHPTLTPGVLETLSVDSIQADVAQAIGVTLELRLVDAGDAAPIAGVRVRWQPEDQEERLATSSADGIVVFTGVERERPQVFELVFPPPETSEALPRWPLQQPVTLTLETPGPGVPQTGRERRTVEIAGLQWLLLDPGGVPLTTDRRGGQPYPIFVLQEEGDAGFSDRSADHFLPRPGGLAVSITTPGRYRVAAYVAPWSVRWSDVTDTRIARSDGMHPVQLGAGDGRHVTLVLRQRGRALANATVLIPGTARGLPPATLRSDAEGQLQLDGVTVPALTLEVAGQGQLEVALERTRVDVEIPLVQ